MSDDDYAKQLEIQRANFEAQFGSLEDMGFVDVSRHPEDSIPSLSDPEDIPDDFAGFDDTSDSADSDCDLADSMYASENSRHVIHEPDPPPKVIKFNTNHTSAPTFSKADAKLLRLGRAPTLVELERKAQQVSAQTKHLQAQALKEDSEHMENDLKLQRLLSESHILAGKLDYSGADVTLQTLDYEDPTGKARRRVLDSRIRSAAALNSKTGGLPQRLEKMPMDMRKGMVKTRDERISRYEQEARDAGIVLAKVRPGEIRNLKAGRGSTQASDRIGNGARVEKKVRDKGLRINGVGRNTRNGLVIAQKDIDRINRTGFKNKKKGKK